MNKYLFVALPHTLIHILGQSSSSAALVHSFHNAEKRSRTGRHPMRKAGLGNSHRLASSSNADEAIEIQGSVSKSKSKSLTEEDHLIHQAKVFDEISDWFADRYKEVPPELLPTYQAMAKEIISSLAPSVEKSSCRILDVACGTGVLWEFLINEASKASLDLTITGVDLSPSMVAYASERAQEPSSGPNDASVHSINVVESDVISFCRNLTDSTSFDGVILNACFGNFFKPRKVLEALPGDKIYISHPLGSGFVRDLHLKDPKTVPNQLPESRLEVATLVFGLPLVLSEMSTQPYYLTTLERTRAKELAQIQRYRGFVDQGYGRGGRKLGFPTANLPASLFQSALEDVTTGVYFGWAALENRPGSIFKAVVNVGYSPTFEGEENAEKIIEAHLILDNDEDLQEFYGEALRLQLIGFLRSEQKFNSFPELVAQITSDVADAKATLNLTPFQELQNDDFLQHSDTWVGTGGGDKTASWEFSSVFDTLEAAFRKGKEQQ
eukprot:scaffold1118_cov135-Cylindrotheca_fusiformis.AAC.11